jgi:hypothetical protein
MPPLARVRCAASSTRAAPMSNPTMAFSIYRRSVFLVVHAKDNPNDEEWEAYVAFSKANLGNFTSTLIITEGGGPNTVQRGTLNDMLEANNFKGKISVVTLNRLVRGIVTALSWFNPNIKAFSTLQIPAALEYLGVPKDQQDAVNAEIKRLRDKLGITTPTS